MADEGAHWSEQSIQPDFQQAASPEQEPTRQQEEQGRGSEMVERDQPVPEPPRPAGAQEVDRQSFNRQWEAEQQRAAWLQEQAQEYQRRREAEMKPPERSIRDDFNLKADELERARFDAGSAQERFETLRSYSRPINEVERMADMDHERQQQSLTEKFEQGRGRDYEDELDLER